MFYCHLLLSTFLCIFLFFIISFTIPGLVIFVENSVEVVIVDLLRIDGESFLDGFVLVDCVESISYIFQTLFSSLGKSGSI